MEAIYGVQTYQGPIYGGTMAGGAGRGQPWPANANHIADHGRPWPTMAGHGQPLPAMASLGSFVAARAVRKLGLAGPTWLSRLDKLAWPSWPGQAGLLGQASLAGLARPAW